MKIDPFKPGAIATPVKQTAVYYAVDDRPVAIVDGRDCLVYDFASGEMLPDPTYVDRLGDRSSEAEFTARVNVLRAESATRAIAQLRTWIDALGSSALGFTGRIEHERLVVEPVPPGYTRVVVDDRAVELRPLGSLLTRPLCDAEFGAGRALPIVDIRTSASIAYPPIGNVALSIEFGRPGAHRIWMRCV